MLNKFGDVMFIIVGTGAGGAILAKELAENNLPVTILEKGPYIKSKRTVYKIKGCI